MTDSRNDQTLRVGQLWRNEEGELVRIVEKDETATSSNSDPYPFRGDNENWYTDTGRYSEYELSRRDLVELVEDTPAKPLESPDAASEPAKQSTTPTPRLFVSTRRTFTPSGDQILDAVADDGTAWYMVGSTWHQVLPLPFRATEN